MNQGLLWFDNSKTATFEQKVQGAARYYRRKLEHMPEICLVHPEAMQQASRIVDCDGYPITVKPYKSILPDHFWIGVETLPTAESL